MPGMRFTQTRQELNYNKIILTFNCAAHLLKKAPKDETF